MRSPRLHLAAFALIALSACYDAQSGAERILEEMRTPKVILVGIDGVRPDVLAEVLTPTLDALATGGLYVADARTTTPSVSGPSWSSMLTGVWPEKHGVTNNEFTGKRYEEYPDFLTRLERARPELTTAAVGDWLPLFVASEGSAAIGDEIDIRHGLDGYELGWAEADSAVTELAVEVLATTDVDALFVYLGNPDETSHQHGSIGAEYRAAIETADRQLGRILDAMRARPGFEREDWLVLSSTDHGRRADGGHGGGSPEEMTIFVLAHGGSAASSAPPNSTFIVDVAATALTHMGVAIEPTWALDGQPMISR